MVLRKEQKGARVVSRKDSMLDIRCLSLDNIGEHCGLKSISLKNDEPILDEVVI